MILGHADEVEARPVLAGQASDLLVDRVPFAHDLGRGEGDREAVDEQDDVGARVARVEGDRAYPVATLRGEAQVEVDPLGRDRPREADVVAAEQNRGRVHPLEDAAQERAAPLHVRQAADEVGDAVRRDPRAAAEAPPPGRVVRVDQFLDGDEDAVRPDAVQARRAGVEVVARGAVADRAVVGHAEEALPRVLLVDAVGRLAQDHAADAARRVAEGVAEGGGGAGRVHREGPAAGVVHGGVVDRADQMVGGRAGERLPLDDECRRDPRRAPLSAESITDPAPEWADCATGRAGGDEADEVDAARVNESVTFGLNGFGCGASSRVRWAGGTVTSSERSSCAPPSVSSERSRQATSRSVPASPPEWRDTYLAVGRERGLANRGRSCNTRSIGSSP